MGLLINPDGVRTPFLKSQNRPGPFAAGDLAKTIERQRRIQAESDARGGYLGMGL